MPKSPAIEDLPLLLTSANYRHFRLKGEAAALAKAYLKADKNREKACMAEARKYGGNAFYSHRESQGGGISALGFRSYGDRPAGWVAASGTLAGFRPPKKGEGREILARWATETAFKRPSTDALVAALRSQLGYRMLSLLNMIEIGKDESRIALVRPCVWSAGNLLIFSVPLTDHMLRKVDKEQMDVDMDFKPIPRWEVVKLFDEA